MKITLLTVGKTSESFLEEGIQKYSKRINRFVKFEIKTVKDVKVGKSMPIKTLKTKEAEEISKHLKSTDYVILLDEKGKDFTSEKFAQYIENKTITNINNLVFIIGGAYGFSDILYQKAKEKISLSKMTFSHQLIRIIFTEQLYRAFSIIHGQPYHNE